MVNKKEDNIKAIFEESINQFNYSSNLFDSLESKSNTIIVFISIILGVALNSYFLEKIEIMKLGVRIIYYIGLILIIISFILMLRLRRRRFKIIKIEDLKKEFTNNPQKNFYKIITGKYIPVIQKNFKQYEDKDKELRFALLVMKIGASILLLTIVYILVIINNY